MDANKTGGPAFPAQFFDERAIGMTLRDYFMAHAPVEPQPWFLPVMVDCPAVPSILSVTDEALRHQLRAMEDGSEDESPEAVAWFENRNLMMAAQEDWQSEFRAQLYIQWPAAWADAMLEQR